jgi:hypothetical protein
MKPLSFFEKLALGTGAVGLYIAYSIKRVFRWPKFKKDPSDPGIVVRISRRLPDFHWESFPNPDIITHRFIVFMTIACLLSAFFMGIGWIYDEYKEPIGVEFNERMVKFNHPILLNEYQSTERFDCSITPYTCREIDHGFFVITDCSKSGPKQYDPQSDPWCYDEGYYPQRNHHRY